MVHFIDQKLVQKLELIDVAISLRLFHCKITDSFLLTHLIHSNFDKYEQN